MKLSLAATLLGQTVPTLSKRYGPIMARDGALRLATEILEDTFPQSILDHNNLRQSGWHYNRRLKRQVAKNLKNAPIDPKKVVMVPCDPRSTDPNIGVLSCGQDSICEPSVTSSLGGVCTPSQSIPQDQGLGRESILPWKNVGQLVNHLPPVTTTGSKLVQCDPKSIDVGILACGEGQFCEHDETSGLGGYCVDTTTSSNRRLAPYYLEEFLFMCGGPTNPYYPYVCDCSGVNNATGTGTMYCTQNFTTKFVPGCDEYVVYDTFSYSFNNSVFVRGRDCYETTTPFIESICFNYYVVEETELVCDAEWNGQRCTSCAITNYGVPAFNCSNVDGGRVGDSRKELLSVFDICSNTTCSNFCGDGFFIPDDKLYFNITEIDYTCGELAYLDENPAFPASYCPMFVEAAQTYCCVPLNSTTSGDGSSTPSPEPEDNSTIPGETDEEEDASSAPEADSDQDNTSAGQSVWNLALVACEVIGAMALVAQV